MIDERGLAVTVGHPRRQAQVEARPRRTARPGRVPVWSPSSTTSRPFTRDVLDPRGELPRVVARGRRLHGCRVEDDDVGLHAVEKQASVGYAQALRRKGRHLPDRLLQGDGAFVTNVVGEDGREGAIGPRAGIVPQQKTVGSHHSQRMDHEVGQGRQVRPGGHVGGLKVFVEEEVAEGVDLAFAHHLSRLGDGAALELLIVGMLEVSQPKVVP